MNSRKQARNYRNTDTKRQRGQKDKSEKEKLRKKRKRSRQGEGCYVYIKKAILTKNEKIWLIKLATFYCSYLF